MNNYMMFAGNEGVYTYTFDYEKRADCPVCGGESRELNVAAGTTLAQLLDAVKELPDVYVHVRIPS